MCREDLLKEVNADELEEFLARLKPQVLEKEYKMAESLVHTIQELGEAHQGSQARVKALLKEIYGEFLSEKFSSAPTKQEEEESKPKPSKKKKRREGGLRSAQSFTGANQKEILFSEDEKPTLCPHCQHKIYRDEPRQLIRYQAAPPITATVYSVQRQRCRHCETVVEAPIPQEIGAEKYDSSVIPWLGYSRYRLGTPMNRLAMCQEQFGIPLPVQTQYSLLEEGSRLLSKIFDLMELAASSSSVLISDDTPNKILNLLLRRDDKGKVRKGVYTSAIRAVLGNSLENASDETPSSDEKPTQILLYYTGNRHQGENMGSLLKRREPGAAKPLHMTDGSFHGKPKGMEGEKQETFLKVTPARCLVHARRRIYKIREDYKEPCAYLLDLFQKIFGIERDLLRNKASPEQRLQQHQEKSGPLMEEILKYCQDSLAEKEVEPNSSLGKAMRYIIEDYAALSLFLSDSRSPLHTNCVERMIKDVARQRKNSLFYRTAQGAGVGDLWLSVIKTCEANRISPWAYLKDLFLKNTAETIMPEHWLPWVWAARQ